jgi:hypothetical protein
MLVVGAGLDRGAGENAAGRSNANETSSPLDQTELHAADQRTFRFDRPRLKGAAPLVHFRLGAHEAAVETLYGADRELLARRLAPIAHSLDLCEPFGRIRDALDEAQRSGK